MNRGRNVALATPQERGPTMELNHQDPGVFRGLKVLLSSARGWLSPPKGLPFWTGKDFGRHIEASVAELRQGAGVGLLQIRKRDAAVVMTVERYEQLVSMGEYCSKLMTSLDFKVVNDKGDQFEALLARIQSSESRKAADSLMYATGEDLRNAYKPGRTETQ